MLVVARLEIEGPCKLRGEVSIHGAKNSALPLLAACLLCNGECILHNCPGLSDVDICIRILEHLGCKVKRSGSDVAVDATALTHSDIPGYLMREMRSSIVFLGAILTRAGQARLSLPGGCELGPRPIDLHLAALRKLGVKIKESHGCMQCTTGSGLVGSDISLSFPSVGATENIMLTAVCAKGITVIHNAAREPEICDLAHFLNRCGAHITGAGEGTIIIDGVQSLHGCEHTVIADRIAAATFMAAAAVTGSHIALRNIIPRHLASVLPIFEEAGCSCYLNGNDLEIIGPERLRPMKLVRTMPYPGFPTDAQAPVMTMAALADGNSMFVETIFENRYKHVCELVRLGAKIKLEGRVAIIEGVPELYGTNVGAAELRGAAALVVAGLAANGKTCVYGLKYLDRGYEHIEESLSQLGAVIIRK